MVCVHERDENAAKAAATAACDDASSMPDTIFDSRSMHTNRARRSTGPPASSDRPVFVTDSGDNTTAGSAGDNAYLLTLMQEKAITGVLLGGLTDEPAVRMCQAARLGDLLDLDLGGTIEPASVRTPFRGRLVYKGDIEGWYGENAGPVRGAPLRRNRCDRHGPTLRPYKAGDLREAW